MILSTIRVLSVTIASVTLLSLSGCYYNRAVIKGHTNEERRELERSDARRAATLQICDGERRRAKDHVLAKYQIGKLQEMALKVSERISDDEKDELRDLISARLGDYTLPPELQFRAEEMISEIYTRAMDLAGFKVGELKKLEGSDWAASTRMHQNFFFAGNSYVNIVSSTTSPTARQLNSVAGVYLGANSDQSRYYVTLLRVYRLEGQGEAATPLYEPVNLSQYAESFLPLYCANAGTALDPIEFNTVEGLPVQERELAGP